MSFSFATILAAITFLAFALFMGLKAFFGNRKTAFSRIFSILDMYVKAVPEHTQAADAVRVLKAVTLRVENDVESENAKFRVLCYVMGALGCAIGYESTQILLFQVSSMGFSLLVLLIVVLGFFGSRQPLKANGLLLLAGISAISDVKERKTLFMLAFRIRSYATILFARNYDKKLRTCSALYRSVSEETLTDSTILFQRTIQAFRYNGLSETATELEAVDYSLRIFEYISLQGINEQDLLKNTNDCRNRLLDHLSD